MHELTLLAGADQVEPLSQALLDELDALSVSVEDADADGGGEQALFGEPGEPPPAGGWPRSVLKALFTDEQRATEAATWLLAQDRAAGVRLASTGAVPDLDWVRLTQAQFAPVEITPSFWIVPSWHEPPAGATRVMRLDPGPAFGTGPHATTRMCLRWIAAQPDERRARWARVLDYGCGSGILAIGAALHGARQIDAIDIDPVAVESTRTNAQTNRVTLKAGPPDGATGHYDLVLAN
ncbi:MAG: 50S ribosomal protein L11 methyltransferase, partial [Rhodospirillaceae bacterium]